MSTPTPWCKECGSGKQKMTAESKLLASQHLGKPHRA